MDFAGRTVILAAGDFPTAEAPLRALREARRLVCCDGNAATAAEAVGFEPMVIVGDCDSLDDETRRRFADKIVEVAEQDDNDLAKAFRYAISQGWRDVVILGATGRREDHTLGNIAHLADFAAEAESLAMVSDYGIFLPVRAPGGKFQVGSGAQISIFGFDPTIPVTATGVKYPVRDLLRPYWWTATLNEAVADVVSVSITRGVVLLYAAFDNAQCIMHNAQCTMKR